MEISFFAQNVIEINEDIRTCLLIIEQIKNENGEVCSVLDALVLFQALSVWLGHLSYSSCIKSSTIKAH